MEINMLILTTSSSPSSSSSNSSSSMKKTMSTTTTISLLLLSVVSMMMTVVVVDANTFDTNLVTSPTCSGGTLPAEWVMTTGSFRCVLSSGGTWAATSIGVGARFFGGHNCNPCAGYVDIDVSALATTIDAGNAAFKASVNIAGIYDLDRADHTFEMLDVSTGVLNSGKIWELGVTQEGTLLSDASWHPNLLTDCLPVGTRTIRWKVNCVRIGGTNCDGYWDEMFFAVKDVSLLKVTMPAPALSTQLLLNGDAELDMWEQSCSVQKWHRNTGDVQVASVPNSGGLGGVGAKVFQGGYGRTTSVEISQHIDISAMAAAATAGAYDLTLDAGGRFGGVGAEDDRVSVNFAVYSDSGHTSLVQDFGTIGDKTAADRGSVTSMLRDCLVTTFSTTSNANYLLVTVTFTKVTETLSDGTFDDLQLFIREGTGQGFVDLSHSSTTYYNIAQTDGVFKICNVDNTGGTSAHLMLNFPANGILKTGLVIVVQDVDMAGHIFLGFSDAGTAKQVHLNSAQVTMQDNNCQRLYFLYAISAGSSLTTTIANSRIEILQNTASSRVAVQESVNSAVQSLTLSAASELLIYNNPSNHLLHRPSGSASNTLTLTGGSSYKITDNACPTEFRVARATGGGTLSFTVSGSSLLEMARNSAAYFRFVESEDATSSITMDTNGASRIDIFENNIGTNGLGFMLYYVDDGASLTVTTSGESSINVMRNTADTIGVFFTSIVTSSVLTMTTTNSKINFVGNVWPDGTDYVRFFVPNGGGTISATTTESSLILLDGNRIAGQFTFGLVYGSGSALTLTTTQSSNIELVGNVFDNFLRFGIALDPVTCTIDTESSSSIVVSRNSALDISVFRAWGAATMTTTISQSSVVDVFDNIMTASLVFLWADQASTTISNTVSKSSIFRAHKNVVGTNLYFGYSSNTADLQMTLSRASEHYLLDNTVGGTTDHARLALGGTVTTTLEKLGRIYKPS